MKVFKHNKTDWNTVEWIWKPTCTQTGCIDASAVTCQKQDLDKNEPPVNVYPSKKLLCAHHSSSQWRRTAHMIHRNERFCQAPKFTSFTLLYFNYKRNIHFFVLNIKWLGRTIRLCTNMRAQALHFCFPLFFQVSHGWGVFFKVSSGIWVNFFWTLSKVT